MNNNSDLLVVRLDQPGVDLALRPRLVLFLIVAAGHRAVWGCLLLWSERLPVRSEVATQGPLVAAYQLCWRPARVGLARAPVPGWRVGQAKSEK